ncbi:MAG TPA: helix-turn-helix domain-containing protein [Acetobacteraceae bacterium]|nr:helix-turn-helix domain-containing protein [Acetobacteraceae bacterium]
MADITGALADIRNTLGRIEKAVELLHTAPRLEPVDPSVKVSTAAAILDCDESFVRKLVKDEELSSHQLGKRGIRIYLSSIEDYRRRSTVLAAGGTPAAGKPKPKPKQSASFNEAMAFMKSRGLV